MRKKSSVPEKISFSFHFIFLPSERFKIAKYLILPQLPLTYQFIYVFFRCETSVIKSPGMF